MKVLVLSHMYPNPVNPHAGIFVHNQCKALMDAGVEVQVVIPTPSFPLYKKWKGYQALPSKTTVEGITVHYVPTRMFPGGFFFSTYDYLYYRALLPIVKQIREAFPFDLIHCHTIFPDGAAGVRLKQQLHIPIVSTIHGSDIMLYPKRSRGVYKRTITALRKSDEVITVSQRLGQEVLTLVPEGKVTTVYNGFSNSFAPSDRSAARKDVGLPQDQTVLLFVGNLYPVKGLTYLLEAFAQLHHQAPQVHLYLIGDGSLKLALQQQTEQANLTSAVSFVGRKPYEEIPRWIQSADVMVLSSLSEGLPSVLLESMACGIPMVATDVGGIAEVLRDQQTGLLVPSKQVSPLADALSTIFVHQPHRRKEMGNQALQVAQAFTWEENAKKMKQLYEAVVGD